MIFLKRATAYSLAAVELFMLCRIASQALAELNAMQADVSAALLIGFLALFIAGTVIIFLMDFIDS